MKLFAIIARWTKRVARVCAVIFAMYLLIVAVGLVPVNNDFEPSNPKDGVVIYVRSSAIHADIVVPTSIDSHDWGHTIPADSFRSNTKNAKWIAFGWGDRGFYVDTPNWSDLRISTALAALVLPSSTCMHVVMLDHAPLGRKVIISKTQYSRLCSFIGKSFSGAEGVPNLIPDAAYGKRDAFFAAVGSYNCLNTCNAWANRGLQSAGVRTPCLAPLPKTLSLYLPESSLEKTTD